MKVVVDTSVWSLALRRSVNVRHPSVTVFRELIEDGRVVLIGAIRQEILSGIKHQQQYTRLKTELRAFPDLILDTKDYEVAAEFCNVCRRRGIQGANTDYLICSVANRRQYQILSTDEDFKLFAEYLPVKLFEISED